MALSNNFREQVFLFEKIFEKDKLKELIEKYKVPELNYKFAFKIKNIAEVYFF